MPVSQASTAGTCQCHSIAPKRLHLNRNVANNRKEGSFSGWLCMAATAWMSWHVTGTLMIEGPACQTESELKAELNSIHQSHISTDDITWQQDVCTNRRARVPCTKQKFERCSAGSPSNQGHMPRSQLALHHVDLLLPGDSEWKGSNHSTFLNASLK